MKKSRLIILIFSSLLVLIAINQYFFCPVFYFVITQPFSGKLFYNPYDSINPNNWVKCNFHVHTNAWHGISSGKGTAYDVYRVYDSMGYTVHCVSDYQSINKTFAKTPGYIPAYEHGYNLGKTHQLVLGSTQVKWIDYLFPQTLNNKQHVLNRLSDQNNVVIINHPAAFHGYHASDFRYLSNYNCIEVLNPYAISTAYWDTALSNGRPVFIVGDDDAHNVFAASNLARMCTWLNVPTKDQATVLKALKKGQNYGMILGTNKTNLPTMESFEVRLDTITIKMNKLAKTISFFGQDGKLLGENTDTPVAKYIIQPGDHYVRTVIYYNDGTEIFLNPVFRYDKKQGNMFSVKLNIVRTCLNRVLGVLIFLLWIRIMLSFVFPRIFRKNVFNNSTPVLNLPV